MNKAKRVAAAVLIALFAAGATTTSAFAGRHHRYYVAAENPAPAQTQAAYVCPYGYEACIQNGACLADGTCPYGAPRNGGGYGGGYGGGRGVGYGYGRCCGL